MNKTIVQEYTVTVKLTRCGHLYFKTLTRNGVEHRPEKITRQDASEIYSRWQGEGKHQRNGHITFDNVRPASWEWSVTAAVEVPI